MAVSTVTEPGQNWLQKALEHATRTPVMATTIIVLCILAALVTYLLLPGASSLSSGGSFPLLIIVDSSLVLLAAALLFWLIVRFLISRRSGSAGAQLHGRLVMIFGVIAIVPAVLTAITAIITTNLAISAWFSSAVRGTLDNSIAIADSYIDEQRQ